MIYNLILVWVVFLRIFWFYVHKMRNINTIIHHLPVRNKNCSKVWYITDGKTQIFTISNHYYNRNLYNYHKSPENAEITLYCTGKVTMDRVESSVISPFLLIHPINFNIKMHVTGTIFVVETYVFSTMRNEKLFHNM